jgi:hypothetical protein
MKQFRRMGQARQNVGTGNWEAMTPRKLIRNDFYRLDSREEV